MSLLSNLLKGIEDNPELIEIAAGLLLPEHPGEDISELAKTGDLEAISELDQYYQTVFSRGSFWADKLPILKTNPSLMLNYLSGSGQDVPLFESQEDLDVYLQQVHDEYGSIKSGFHLPTYGEAVLDLLGSKGQSWQFNTEPITGDTWDVTDFVKMQMAFEDESIDLYPVWGGQTGDTYSGTIEEFPEFLWHESENPEYPAEDGWEFLRYDPTRLPMMQDYGQSPELFDIYNKLGPASTVRRRKIADSGPTGPSKYEYHIVEPWDILTGESEKAHGMEDDWRAGTGSYISSSRNFPAFLANLASKYLPDFAEVEEGWNEEVSSIGFPMDPKWEDIVPENERGVAPYLLYYLDKYSAPFDITGTSIVEE